VKNKFFGVKARGYDMYYILPGSQLDIEDVTMESFMPKGVAEPTKAQLKKAFVKSQKTKAVSRVFLNRFISQMA